MTNETLTPDEKMLLTMFNVKSTTIDLKLKIINDLQNECNLQIEEWKNLSVELINQLIADKNQLLADIGAPLEESKDGLESEPGNS